MDARSDIGRIVWHDLMTDDIAGARRFYAELFGWEYRIEHASECAWTGGEADYPLILCNGQAHGGGGGSSARVRVPSRSPERGTHAG